MHGQIIQAESKPEFWSCSLYTSQLLHTFLKGFITLF